MASVAQHLELGYEQCESSPLTALAHLGFINGEDTASQLFLEDASGDLEDASLVDDATLFQPASLLQPQQLEGQSQQPLAELYHESSQQQDFSPSCSPLEQQQIQPFFTLQTSGLVAHSYLHIQLEHYPKYRECPSGTSLHQGDTLHPSQDQALFRYHSDMTECLPRTPTCSSSSFGSSGTSATAYSMQQPSRTSSYGEGEGTTYFSQSPSPPAVEYAQSPYCIANTRPVYYHTPGIARYGCTFYDCNWATDRRDLLRQHLEHHAHQAIFNCTVQGCYKHFAILENLEAHQFEEHSPPMQSSHSITHLRYASPATHPQYPSHDATESSNNCYAEVTPPLQYTHTDSTVGLGLVRDFSIHELSLGASPGSAHSPTHVQHHALQTVMIQPPHVSMPPQYRHHFSAARRNSDTEVYDNYIATPSSTLEPAMPTLYEDETFASPAQFLSPAPQPPMYPHPVSPPAAVREEYYMYIPSLAPRLPAHASSSATHVKFNERMFGNSPDGGTQVLSPNISQQSSNLGEPLDLQCNVDSYIHSDAFAHTANEYADTKLSPILDSIFSPFRNTAQARFTRASLARRGSEASYLASHPRFAAHPYAISTSSSYIEPAVLRPHPRQQPVDQNSHQQQQLPSSPLVPQPPKLKMAKARLMPGPKPGTLLPRKKSLSASSPITDMADNVKLHPCAFEGCDRAFKRFEHKKRHERSHTQEKPYGCDIVGCGRFFSRSDNLTQHKRTHKRNGRTQRLTQANLQYAQEGKIPEDDDDEHM